MKEVKRLTEVEAIKNHDSLGLFFKNTIGDLHSFDKAELIARNIYDFKFTNNGIVYTKAELGDLYVAINNGSEKVLKGNFYLGFFKQLSRHYAVVKNDFPDDIINKVFLVDHLFENLKPFKSFRVAVNGYFATGKGNEIVVFDENLKELWKYKLTEIDDSLSMDEKIQRTFYSTNYHTLIIPLTSGQLLALDLFTGDLMWKQERVGRIALFKDKIYCVVDYSIKELDANSGKTLRQRSIHDLVGTYEFRPTGAHKAYDEYIFAMNSGKPGMVAIYDRRTLEFQEVIKLDEMIPMGTDYLHWDKGKLYILDFRKVLHVFEDPET